MKHHQETEIKLEVRDLGAIRRRLAALEFRPIEARHFESNVLFDFKDLRLRKARCLLRLRFAGGKSVLTFKGAPLRARQFKIRREIEALVEGGPRLKEIFHSFGLRKLFRYDKYRTVYARRSKSKSAATPTLVLDETPIGDYAELEGSKTWIERVASQLGYGRGDYIVASYGDLYRQKCLERGRKPGDMVFSSRK
jgi:adenylate cyclase class 2